MLEERINYPVLPLHHRPATAADQGTEAADQGRGAGEAGILGVGPGEGAALGEEIAWASASESFPRSGLVRCASNAKSEYLIPLCGHTRGDGVGVSYKELRRLGGSEEASPLWDLGGLWNSNTSAIDSTCSGCETTAKISI